MTNSKLILLEGMPSTGKTTNARLLQMQMERNHVDAKWIHEVSMPHPVLFFDEVGFTYEEYAAFLKTYPEAADVLNQVAVTRKSTVGIHLPQLQWYYQEKISEEVYQALLQFDTWKFPLEKYQTFALEKWAQFTEHALEQRDTVTIIDSALLQFQIFTFQFQNAPYEQLQRFVGQIQKILQPLNPCLIFLYRENTDATIAYLENDRGPSYLEYMWNRDKDQPYYAGRPPGAESFKQFLRDYASSAAALFDCFPSRKISIEISEGDWTCYEDRMLSFLDVPRQPSPDAVPQNGIYVNDALGYVIKVDGLSITDPTEKTRKLFPKSHNEFYVDWLPAILRFEDQRVTVSGAQICERWTETGMVYKKIQ